MKIKKELFNRLKSNENDIFIKSKNKFTTYGEFIKLVSKSITYITENYPKKKLFLLIKILKNFLSFLLLVYFQIDKFL